MMGWALLARFSSALFPSEAPVEASALMTALALVVVALGIRPCLNAAVGKRRDCAFGLVASVAAALASVLPCALGASSGAGASAARVLTGYCVVGILLGVFALGMARLAIGRLRSLGFHAFVGLCLPRMAVAALLYVAMGCALPRGAGWVTAVLPVVGGFLWRAPASGCSGAGFVPVVVSKPRGTTLRSTTTALAGFLFVLMPAMYPKTTNLAPYCLSGGVVGMVSWRCVLAVMLIVTLTALLAFVLDRRQRSLAAGVAVAVAVFGATYFSLPSMSRSPVPFILITPVSVILLACCLGVSARDGREAIARGALLASLGGLMASAFAYVFLVPLFGVLPHQDALFSLVPAVVLASVTALMLIDGNDYAEVLFPTSTAESERVLTSKDERCAHLSARYGLTARESQVLALVAEGRNEPYIEKALSISRATVKTHVSHIYRKVGVSSRQELLDVVQQG